MDLQTKTKDLVGLFRTSQSGDSVYRFEPRGLDLSRSYQIHFVNSGQVVEISGSQLLQNGILVRLDENLSSELLLIEPRN